MIEENSTCLLQSVITTSLKVIAWHALILETLERKCRFLSVCPRSTSGTVQTSLQQERTQHTQKTFASPPKNHAEKRKSRKEKERQLQNVLR